MNKAVLFDLDGTLLHTLPDIAYKVNVTLTKFGYPTLSDAQIMQNIGNGTRYLISKSVGGNEPQDRVEKVLAYFLELYSQKDNSRTCVFDGIKQTLLTLNKSGYKICIVTNKPQPATDAVVSELLQDLPFYRAVGQSENVKCKPDPTATLNLLKEMDVLPQNAYFVGDGETDVQTAKNAGVNGISVLWGYRTKEQLSSVGATVFAQNPKDLLKLISL